MSVMCEFERLPAIRRWSKRPCWRCCVCHALVLDAIQHAGWHYKAGHLDHEPVRPPLYGHDAVVLTPKPNYLAFEFHAGR